VGRFYLTLILLIAIKIDPLHKKYNFCSIFHLNIVLTFMLRSEHLLEFILPIDIRLSIIDDFLSFMSTMVCILRFDIR
jgi:hypothetical protein